jgi:hypothetical protein
MTKRRHLREGDRLDDDDIVVIRGGDLDPDVVRADALRYHAIYGDYGISVVDIEQSEAHRTVKLDTLERVADALGCEVVYFLVPHMSLEETVRAQARRKASGHLDRVAHHGKLEDQELAADVAAEQLDRFATDLVDKRGLWSPDTP